MFCRHQQSVGALDVVREWFDLNTFWRCRITLFECGIQKVETLIIWLECECCIWLSRGEKIYTPWKVTSRIMKVNYNYYKNYPRILWGIFLKPYNFDNFIRRRLTDHNKIKFAIKYLLMSHLGWLRHQSRDHYWIRVFCCCNKISLLGIWPRLVWFVCKIKLVGWGLIKENFQS